MRLRGRRRKPSLSLCRWRCVPRTSQCVVCSLRLFRLIVLCWEQEALLARAEAETLTELVLMEVSCARGH